MIVSTVMMTSVMIIVMLRCASLCCGVFSIYLTMILITHCCQDPFLVAVVHVLFTIRNVIMVFGLTAIAIVWQVLRASNCGVANVEFCRTEFSLILFDYDTRSAILLHQL